MLPQKWKPLRGPNSPLSTHMLHLSKQPVGRNSSTILKANLKPLLAMLQYPCNQTQAHRVNMLDYWLSASILKLRETQTGISVSSRHLPTAPTPPQQC